MEYRKFGSKYVVRLDIGEDIVQSVKELAEKEGIRLGVVTGIGAVNKATIGLYEVSKQQYISTELSEDMEIVSLGGNISEMNGEVYVHLHIALGCSGSNVKAGHLNSAIISGTGELIIDEIVGAVDRVKDNVSGLNIFKFNN
ncbi:MAG: DNA-binding protein [Tissierellia bacterium]|nr:DNA-binding protein [Tissierellia bacterium]MDD4726131.1 DNA-binding protein [Tissierellia bacterium]